MAGARIFSPRIESSESKMEVSSLSYDFAPPPNVSPTFVAHPEA